MDPLEDRLSALAARFRRVLRILRGCDDGLRLVGRVTVETRDARTGALIPAESGTTENMVVDVGLVELAKILTKYAPATGYQIAVGTGANTPAAGDVALQAEVFRDLATFVSSAGAVFTASLFLDTTDANGYTLIEAALFHNGVMVDRAPITSVAKTAAKTVTVSVNLTISR